MIMNLRRFTSTGDRFYLLAPSLVRLSKAATRAAEARRMSVSNCSPTCFRKLYPNSEPA